MEHTDRFLICFSTEILMIEAEQRALIVRLAEEWIGTPYTTNAMIKGRRGGVDCAMLLLAVYHDAGVVPEMFEPRPYAPDWHLHRGEERYLNTVRQYGHQIFELPKPGDVVMFKVGRLYAHGAIVENWPIVIHARSGPVSRDNVEMNNIGKKALKNMDKEFYSFWKEG
jgi:cell wall-associated NlpC family hydrolase